MLDSLPALDCRLYRVAQARQLDGLAITEQPIAGFELMQRAGRATWDLLTETWHKAKHIVVVCGAGNNGGDGYIVAAHALADGRQVSVLALHPHESLQGDAYTAARKYLDAGGGISNFSVEALLQADVIVDALFGTGLDRDVSGDYLAAIHSINTAGKPILAVDIPSGLNADTGKVMGAAVRANITLSFIARKQGLYTGDAAACCGVMKFTDLGVAQRILDQAPVASDLLQIKSLLGLLSKRLRTAHKGHYGHLLVVGGDYGYAGSVRMCAETAARSGAGLVSVATRQAHAMLIPVARPELMASGVDESADLQALLVRASVVAIGPGLGQTDWSAALLAKVLDTRLPLVVDADALNLLAQDPVHRDNWVLTPHPGEAARLLGTSVAEIEADRFAAANAIQNSFGGVVVLKGSGTLIADHSGRVSVCAAGNPGMASGGMGDVLTGLIAGLICQHLELGDAARLGVCVHGSAADSIAVVEGERGMLASDLIPVIRQLLNS